MNVDNKLVEHVESAGSHENKSFAKIGRDERVDVVGREAISEPSENKSLGGSASISKWGVVTFEKMGTAVSLLAKKVYEYVGKCLAMPMNSSSGLDESVKLDRALSSDSSKLIAAAPECVGVITNEDLKNPKTLKAFCNAIQARPEKVLPHITKDQLQNKEIGTAVVKVMFENPAMAIRLAVNGKFENNNLHDTLFKIVSGFTKEQINDKSIKIEIEAIRNSAWSGSPTEIGHNVLASFLIACQRT